MSTRSTLLYGKQFHLFREALDDDFIYLTLEGLPFEASYNQVTVSIPVHIWEVIRTQSGVDLSYADMSDEELMAMVTRQVDERLQSMESAKTESSRRLLALAGMLYLGSADDPKEDQIKTGIESYQKLRQHQREIRDAIATLRQVCRL